MQIRQIDPAQLLIQIELRPLIESIICQRTKMGPYVENFFNPGENSQSD